MRRRERGGLAGVEDGGAIERVGGLTVRSNERSSYKGRGSGEGKSSS